ncbi:flagellar basal-body rod protein FlgB [Litorimonas taeanensis]|uniref:Flagellar basal-body rod protein FlgB n=1 Tax=Litorimonas taeanensis TaxID=568099 RepID=A0A420WMA3_9PROT|nr:flagellar basal body protein [Litorimonas taeanensis]RKQ72143.1 flagellar basal-body rod protein FlgB [Litorimonas taeanensis]
MLKSTNIVNLTSSMASHAAQRHAVIAENIANSDTPNYKAKDLQPFADVYKAALQKGDDVTGVEFRTIESNMGDTTSPNGNSVSLEDQMMRSAQTQNDHAMALMVYKKSLSLMKMAIGKNL